jgi:hypothetical protein
MLHGALFGVKWGALVSGAICGLGFIALVALTTYRCLQLGGDASHWLRLAADMIFAFFFALVITAAATLLASFFGAAALGAWGGIVFRPANALKSPEREPNSVDIESPSLTIPRRSRQNVPPGDCRS